MTKPRYSSLPDYLAVVRKRRVLVLAMTVLFAGVALLISVRQDAVYQSEAAVIFRDPSSGVGNIGLPEANRETPENRSAAKAETATRDEVLRGAARRLGGRVNLRGAVTARAETRTNFVVITAEASSARRAAEIADAVSRELVEVSIREERDRFSELIRRHRERRERFPGDSPLQRVRRSELQQQIARLETARDITNPASLAREARVPSSPTAPKPLRNTLIGLVVGLSLGVLAAFLRDSLDRRLHGPREVADEADLPLLGVVRNDAMGRAIVGDPVAGRGDEEMDLEAFRILRTNLEFLDVDRPLRKIVVTSALPGEGKSTVAASLAIASALSGKRVLLVEGDLRRPVLAERFGLDPGPGLSDHLIGRAQPAEVLRTVSLAAPSTNGDAPAEVQGVGSTLVVITAGTPVPRPAELLASERLASFVDRVADVYDLVVFDSTPLLPVVDTLELVPRMDAVVLCVRSGQTTRDQLHAARAALARLPDRPVGVVVTDVRSGEGGEYGYYSYQYSA